MAVSSPRRTSSADFDKFSVDLSIWRVFVRREGEAAESFRRATTLET
jgi:hypothetical protein